MAISMTRTELMSDGEPSNSEYLPLTEFYRYGDSIITRLHTVTCGECMRVMYLGRTYFVAQCKHAGCESFLCYKGEDATLCARRIA